MKQKTSTASPFAEWLPAEAHRFQQLVWLHSAAMLMLITWGYGGQSTGVRQLIAWWGSIGVALTAVLAWKQAAWHGRSGWQWLAPLWPLGGYNLLIGISTFNPSFEEIVLNGQLVMSEVAPVSFLPSTAVPGQTWTALWLTNVLILTSFNLLAVTRSVRQLRWILWFAGGNAAVLSLFGTLQYLSGTEGIWFGRVVGPNPQFFASFIYRNHWSAFALLNVALWLSLLLTSPRRKGRPGAPTRSELWCYLGILWLTLTIPLSGSRSGTGLLVVLLAAGLWGWAQRILKPRRRSSRARRTALLILVSISGILWIGFLSRQTLHERWHTTVEQFEETKHSRMDNSRVILYRDTWEMASEKPIAGWGLDSYAHVFQRFNTQGSLGRQGPGLFFDEAHNDWLQSMAEVGLLGTLLRGLLLWTLLRGLGRRAWRSLGPRYLLIGCVSVAVYALLEFPFANPAVVFTFWILIIGARRWGQLAAGSPPKASRDVRSKHT